MTKDGVPPGRFKIWYFSDTRVMPFADYKGDYQYTVWLPNEEVAKQWLYFHQTGDVAPRP